MTLDQNVTNKDGVQDSFMRELRCPRCLCHLRVASEHIYCGDTNCEYSSSGFPVSLGQPVLIDFENSIFSRQAYEDSSGSVIDRTKGSRGLRPLLRRVISIIFDSGTNRVAAEKCDELLEKITSGSDAAKVLVIGGGTIGSGANAMYQDPRAQIVGTDVYASDNTAVVADGHRLPFASESFDAVWIQAVLEHVLEPQKVVDEIHRVLKQDGLVYADSPFMQQVHERAYDFCRFTQSGHRWLFRKFEQIEAGVVSGAGTATIWSIKYFARALGAGSAVSTLFALPFFWFGYVGRLARGRENADAASATYFFGIKSDVSIKPKDMVAYYESIT